MRTGASVETSGNFGVALVAFLTTLFECLHAAAAVVAMANVMLSSCRTVAPGAALQLTVHIKDSSCDGIYTISRIGRYPE